jgi:hypothetical protein
MSDWMLEQKLDDPQADREVTTEGEALTWFDEPDFGAITKALVASLPLTF